MLKLIDDVGVVLFLQLEMLLNLYGVDWLDVASSCGWHILRCHCAIELPSSKHACFRQLLEPCWSPWLSALLIEAFGFPEVSKILLIARLLLWCNSAFSSFLLELFILLLHFILIFLQILNFFYAGLHLLLQNHLLFGELFIFSFSLVQFFNFGLGCGQSLLKTFGSDLQSIDCSILLHILL